MSELFITMSERIRFYHYMMMDRDKKFVGFITEKSRDKVKALAKYYKKYGYKISGELFVTNGYEEEI